MANPWLWIAVSLLLILASIVLASVSLIGPMVFCLLTPLLCSGALRACQKASNSERLEVSDFFSGFQTNTNGLVILGVIIMACQAGFVVLFEGSLVARLVSLLLLFPLVMAIWFAPALVFFNNMPPVEALKASFNACLKNTLPFLVYGLIVMVLLFFATLPVGLGFLALIPALSGSVYVSYRDIFVAN